VCWPAVTPLRDLRGGFLGQVSASFSCLQEKPTVPWVSCSLGFVPQYLCPPPRDGRGLPFSFSVPSGPPTIGIQILLFYLS